MSASRPWRRAALLAVACSTAFAQSPSGLPAELVRAYDDGRYRAAAEGLDRLLAASESDASDATKSLRKLRAHWFEYAVLDEPGSTDLRAAAVRALRAHAADLPADDARLADLRRRALALESQTPTPAGATSRPAETVDAPTLHAIAVAAEVALEGATPELREAALRSARARFAALPEHVAPLDRAALRALVALAGSDWRDGLEAVRLLKEAGAVEASKNSPTLLSVLNRLAARGWWSDAAETVAAREEAFRLFVLQSARLAEGGFVPDGASASAPGATGLPLRVRHIASGASFALVVPRGDELAALRSLGLTVPDADRAASRPFYCARFETTNAEYRLFRPDHHLVALPAAAHDPSCWAVTNAAFPVVRVTFAEAAEFAASRRCAIPSWLEWFAAARAFSGSEVFPSSGEEFAAASRPPNFWDASTLAFFTNLQTRPAAFPWSDGAPLLRSTAFAGDQVGVHDLVGNAAEWIDGPGRAAGRRPAAGGSWKTPRFDSEEAAANAYFGDDRDATAAHSDVGVRLVFRFDV